MENKKSNTGLIVTLVVLVMVILFGGTLFVLSSMGYVSFGKEDVKEENTNNKSDEKDLDTKVDIEYIAEDYVTLEDVESDNENVKLQRVVFKNLDKSLTKEFLNEQENMITDAKNVYSEEDYTETSKSNIWYQVNKNILTVYYEIVKEVAIGSCPDINVINIDLFNKKVLTNEDLLALGGTSFNEIALEEYNSTLDGVKECQKTGECMYYDTEFKEITLNEYVADKQEIVNKIETGLNDVIHCYIKDGIIKYDYRWIEIDVLYLYVGKGGCFYYDTAEIGKYE